MAYFLQTCMEEAHISGLLLSLSGLCENERYENEDFVKDNCGYYTYGWLDSLAKGL